MKKEEKERGNISPTTYPRGGERSLCLRGDDLVEKDPLMEKTSRSAKELSPVGPVARRKRG